MESESIMIMVEEKWINSLFITIIIITTTADRLTQLFVNVYTLSIKAYCEVFFINIYITKAFDQNNYFTFDLG